MSDIMADNSLYAAIKLACTFFAACNRLHWRRYSATTEIWSELYTGSATGNIGSESAKVGLLNGLMATAH